MLPPPLDHQQFVNAAKAFTVVIEGPEELSLWFMETLRMIQTVGWRYGMPGVDGEMRYVNNTNGGPVFVYVKNERIVRITPIEFDDAEDAPSWSVTARGQTFTPPRRTTVAPHALASKSVVYSKDRLLYPLKRVDFDPNGNRNCGNRGKSGYERISWDEALDIVSSEIKRVKKEHGPGAMAHARSAHHIWGNIGYFLSAAQRFMNLVGYTDVHSNPDSWEGWYWGAAHHWGYTMRVGQSETYGTVEDLLENCEMIVYWSSNPESTGASYCAYEGTVRRRWLSKLDIKQVHIDPYFNDTAQLMGGKWLAPRPTTSPALAMAIAYVWITEDLYDKDFVKKRTLGFEKWRDYEPGADAGIPKTPEWQEG